MAAASHRKPLVWAGVALVALALAVLPLALAATVGQAWVRVVNLALLYSPHFGLHLPFWITLPLGFLVAAFFGVLLGAPTLKLRGDYLAIVTLGFGEIIRIFLNNLNAPINITNGPQGINLIDPIRIFGVSL